MAFMMPVVKKNYALYGKQRKTSSETDGHRKTSQPINAQGMGAGRRKVRSEGPSLSTSPAAVLGSEVTMTHAMHSSTKPIGMRRGRGSAPALAPSASLIKSHSVPGGPSTAPTGSSPGPISSPSRSASSSSSSSGSTGAIGRFHTKLVARLRRSFRFKDADQATS